VEIYLRRKHVRKDEVCCGGATLSVKLVIVYYSGVLFDDDCFCVWICDKNPYGLPCVSCSTANRKRAGAPFDQFLPCVVYCQLSEGFCPPLLLINEEESFLMFQG
jgi:hypothetical protein